MMPSAFLKWSEALGAPVSDARSAGCSAGCQPFHPLIVPIRGTVRAFQQRREPCLQFGNVLTSAKRRPSCVYPAPSPCWAGTSALAGRQDFPGRTAARRRDRTQRRHRMLVFLHLRRVAVVSSGVHDDRGVQRVDAPLVRVLACSGAKPPWCLAPQIAMVSWRGFALCRHTIKAADTFKLTHHVHDHLLSQVTIPPRSAGPA
jgi:hypothetical protein